MAKTVGEIIAYLTKMQALGLSKKDEAFIRDYTPTAKKTEQSVKSRPLRRIAIVDRDGEIIEEVGVMVIHLFGIPIRMSIRSNDSLATALLRAGKRAENAYIIDVQSDYSPPMVTISLL